MRTAADARGFDLASVFNNVELMVDSEAGSEAGSEADRPPERAQGLGRTPTQRARSAVSSQSCIVASRIRSVPDLVPQPSDIRLCVLETGGIQAEIQRDAYLRELQRGPCRLHPRLLAAATVRPSARKIGNGCVLLLRETIGPAHRIVTLRAGLVTYPVTSERGPDTAASRPKGCPERLATSQHTGRGHGRRLSLLGCPYSLDLPHRTLHARDPGRCSPDRGHRNPSSALSLIFSRCLPSSLRAPLCPRALPLASPTKACASTWSRSWVSNPSNSARNPPSRRVV